jgi:hypothetical protein
MFPPNNYFENGPRAEAYQGSNRSVLGAIPESLVVARQLFGFPRQRSAFARVQEAHRRA